MYFAADTSMQGKGDYDMRKKGLVILTAALLLNVCCFTLAYAYSVSTAKAMNEFTVGDNEIEINEVFDPPGWMDNGDEIQKEVTATNTGRSSCAVRVLVKPDNMDVMNYITLDFDTRRWHDGGDGYYYYKGILAPGQTTEALFSKVVVETAYYQYFQIFVVGESRAAEKNQHWDDVWSDKL